MHFADGIRFQLQPIERLLDNWLSVAFVHNVLLRIVCSTLPLYITFRISRICFMECSFPIHEIGMH